MSADYKQLCAEFDKPNADLNKVGELVKSCIANFSANESSVEYQNILEMGCLWAAHSRDGLAFERYFSQLASIIYFSAGQSLDSVNGDRKWLLIGLQLLNLLVTGRIAEFHILMEQLPETSLLTNPFITFPLKLEQSLIEGTYHRIWEAKESAPAIEYGWFIDGLVDSIRNELIRGLESSMTSISIEELSKLLLIKSTDIKAIEHLASQRGWSVNGVTVAIRPAKDHEGNHGTATNDLSRVLQYARQLEQII